MLQAPSHDSPASTAPRPFVNFSKFATGDLPTVHVPMKVINRPIPSVLDEEKVLRFMDDIKKGDDFTPIEVLKCTAPDGQRYYFAFGGCHRFEAHKRLQSETIPSRIIEVPPSALRMYLGASCPF
ncbi:hypothetical protein JCM8115_003530 [Rhodotorula mucilaginosa]|nr:hypothetical protein B0A53_00921 [Rhodotorula sp. CCFEE 5036]